MNSDRIGLKVRAAQKLSQLKIWTCLKTFRNFRLVKSISERESEMENFIKLKSWEDFFPAPTKTFREELIVSLIISGRVKISNFPNSQTFPANLFKTFSAEEILSDFVGKSLKTFSRIVAGKCLPECRGKFGSPDRRKIITWWRKFSARTFFHVQFCRRQCWKFQ